MARILATPEEWDNAQQLLRLAYGINVQPAECDRLCDLCGHVGWSWDIADKSVCMICIAERMTDHPDSPLAAA